MVPVDLHPGLAGGDPLCSCVRRLMILPWSLAKKQAAAAGCLSAIQTALTCQLSSPFPGCLAFFLIRVKVSTRPPITRRIAPVKINHSQLNPPLPSSSRPPEDGSLGSLIMVVGLVMVVRSVVGGLVTVSSVGVLSSDGSLVDSVVALVVAIVVVMVVVFVAAFVVVVVVVVAEVGDSPLSVIPLMGKKPL